MSSLTTLYPVQAAAAGMLLAVLIMVALDILGRFRAGKRRAKSSEANPNIDAGLAADGAIGTLTEDASKTGSARDTAIGASAAVHALAADESFDLVVAAGKARRLVEQPDALVELLFQLAQTSWSMDGCLLIHPEGQQLKVTCSSKAQGRGLEAQLAEDRGMRALFRLIGEAVEPVTITTEHPRYSSLPETVRGIGAQWLVFARMMYRGEPAVWIGYAMDQEQWTGPYSYRVLMLGSVLGPLNDLLLQQSLAGSGSATALQQLRSLAQLVDCIEPGSSGRSEQVGRYAAAIARQLGLEPQLAQRASLVSSLGRIGLLGCPEELYMRHDVELQSELWRRRIRLISAELVRSLTGDLQLAADLHGEANNEATDSAAADSNSDETGQLRPDPPAHYDEPSYLAAAQAAERFVSLLSAGSDTVRIGSFADTMSQLRLEAGSQLNARAVEALTAWFALKREQIPSSERSLGYCWEMNCAPLTVCRSCPAYEQYAVNCWEQLDNACKAHGKSCSTCYVYTESQDWQHQQSV
ncbi:hypothetical protein [Paenibacillus sp. YYML68]|uniref:hypothetical protein n=1 Tax=Paenibacillus sp. YYML68 TaxID=2909250 RepID=UPI002491D35C|nr:hypothetical protein [Paenibacillus sp. YYML68]